MAVTMKLRPSKHATSAYRIGELFQLVQDRDDRQIDTLSHANDISNLQEIENAEAIN